MERKQLQERQQAKVQEKYSISRVVGGRPPREGLASGQSCILQCIILKVSLFRPRQGSRRKTSVYIRLIYEANLAVILCAYKCKKFGGNLLLRWIPGVFITPGTYHFSFFAKNENIV